MLRYPKQTYFELLVSLIKPRSEFLWAIASFSLMSFLILFSQPLKITIFNSIWGSDRVVIVPVLKTEVWLLASMGSNPLSPAYEIC